MSIVWTEDGVWYAEGRREIFRGSPLDLAARLDECQQALERIADNLYEDNPQEIAREALGQ